MDSRLSCRRFSISQSLYPQYEGHQTVFSWPFQESYAQAQSLSLSPFHWWEMYRTLLRKVWVKTFYTSFKLGAALSFPWDSQFHPMRLTVSSHETHSFIPWNTQFHPMKLTVSSYETHSFILWNSQFHPMKLTVSSHDLFLETIYALNIRRLEESFKIHRLLLCGSQETSSNL